MKRHLMAVVAGGALALAANMAQAQQTSAAR